MNENDDPTRDDGVRIILHGNKKTKKNKKKIINELFFYPDYFPYIYVIKLNITL